MEIEFQFPQLLVLMLLVLPVVYFIHYGYALREKMLNRFAGSKINSHHRAWLVSILSFCVLVTLLIISAGPKRVLNSGERKLSGDFVIMVDVSRSMAARQSCNESTRLDRAKIIMSEVISEIPEAKFGFMGVAGLTFVLSELSFDRQYMFDVINHGIFVEVIPMPGSDIANALHVLMEKKMDQPPIYESVKHVVLISDGDISEEEINALKDVSPLVSQSEIVVHSVGVGSDDGIPIPTLDANRQCISGQFERANGKEFYTHLLESPLISVADNTGGIYFHESQTEELIDALRSSLVENPALDVPSQTQDITMPFIVILALSLFCLFLIKKV